MAVNQLSGNWKKLQASLNFDQSHISEPQTNGRTRKNPFNTSKSALSSSRKRLRGSDRSMQANSAGSGVTESENPSTSKISYSTDTNELRVNAGLSSDVVIGQYVALDCEMVGVGLNPDLESVLARVSVVDYNGVQVYDSYVLPKEKVTDWRTHVSGITPRNMRDARLMEEVQAEVSKILKGRIVIGHSIRKDFQALMLDHPMRDIRDTAKHPAYRKFAGGGSPKLKVLASEILGVEIQNGEHSSVEDARVCMLLFRKDKVAFDQEHAKRYPVRVASQQNNKSDSKKPQKKKKKKKR